jgi:hypothetical protein
MYRAGAGPQNMRETAKKKSATKTPEVCLGGTLKTPNNKWKAAIINALREKGFTKQGARKTAVMTIKRSIERRNRDFRPTPSIVRPASGAIHQKGTMAGKIVVIPPQT